VRKVDTLPLSGETGAVCVACAAPYIMAPPLLVRRCGLDVAAMHDNTKVQLMRKYTRAGKRVVIDSLGHDMPILDITPADIALLSDVDLRALVARLCEAEVRRFGFSATAVTWGGHQDASDGGSDVRVSLPRGSNCGQSIPRPNTVFQVKKGGMAASKITQEMRPKGKLREAIRKLIAQSGSYVLVTSAANTSDTELAVRLSAMRKALGRVPNRSRLKLDFYDRSRIASWVREHAGVMIWLKEQIGKQLRGWRGYGPWTFEKVKNEEYLVDEHARITEGWPSRKGSIGVLDGMQKINEKLRHPSSVVRLVGLSGVGKTRFVQALFDARLGEFCLDSGLAIYTNMNENPDPQPMELLSDLIVSSQKAILIVDNCRPDLHRRLSERCRTENEFVSLITVEHDVQDDESEGTDFFSLEPSSDALVRRLIHLRYPAVSHVNIEIILRVSGGNSRVALALSGTVGKNQTITSLSDRDLFARLFNQGNAPDENLLSAARALSLVYSYQGEDVSSGEECELLRLGATIGKTADEMFRSSISLLGRDLVQKRGVWRAVLPHALANRLAIDALELIPSSTLQANVMAGAPERLQKSFARRLTYLGDNQSAKDIVKRWLDPLGRLGNLAKLNELERQLFAIVAPVYPEATLDALERACRIAASPDELRSFLRYAYTLRSIAYDAILFDRCVKLISDIAEVQNSAKHDEVLTLFASLFPLFYSGTNATIEQRLAVAESLITCESEKNRQLGFKALSSILEAFHFGAGFDFEFGTQSRSFGYWPRNKNEERTWYERALGVAESLACSSESWATEVLEIIGKQFRGIWRRGLLCDALESLFLRISETGLWIEGWLAVRQTIFFDSQTLAADSVVRLKALEQGLRPKSLVDRARAFVMAEPLRFVGIDGRIDDPGIFEKSPFEIDRIVEELARELATDLAVFEQVLPGFMEARTEQLTVFGRAFAQHVKTPRSAWANLLSGLKRSRSVKANPTLLGGFLSGLSAVNRTLTEDLLDECVEDEVLAPWYPILQMAAGINSRGVERLIYSLEVGVANINTYYNLISGGVTHEISGVSFNRLLSRIGARKGGNDIALQILMMRISFGGGEKSSPGEIIDIGCSLLAGLELAEWGHGAGDHYLRIVAKACLEGSRGDITVRGICRRLIKSIEAGQTYAFNQSVLLETILTAQPAAVLDVLCGEDAAQLQVGMRVLSGAGMMQRNPWDAIPEEELIAWCERQPESRYAAAAEGVTVFHWSDPHRPQWTPIALRLLGSAPNRIEVLKKFTQKFSPHSWSGSLAKIIDANSSLLDHLNGHGDPLLSAFIDSEKMRFRKIIESEKNIEKIRHAWVDERFE